MTKYLSALLICLLGGCGGSANPGNENNNININTKIQVCGDGVVDPGEVCDDGSGNSDLAPNACRTNCRAAHCGDGVVDDGEECDDGNGDTGDGCHECQAEVGWECDSGGCATICGDGLAIGTETCDGTDFQGKTCATFFEGFRGPLVCASDCSQISTAACTAPRCGDGVVDVSNGEECDDGNLVSGDGCSATCTLEICGNGVRDEGEVCDCGTDPTNLPTGCNGINSMEPDACRPDCAPARNGDLVIDPSLGENCDDNGLPRDDPNYEADFGGWNCLEDWEWLAGWEQETGVTATHENIRQALACTFVMGSSARNIDFSCGICGDNRCTGPAENCCNCPEDCGECPPGVTCP